jgi:uncharacterized repeat protein (TIGR01451 family)
VNAVLVAIVMVFSPWQGQVPPLQASPAVQEPARLPALPASQPPTTKPPALVPVHPDQNYSTPPTAKSCGAQLNQEGTKPAPFKLVETPRTVSGVPPDKTTLVDPLPPGVVATPCLVLQRTAPAQAQAGQSFSYEIIVRNAGSAAAAQARLEEVLPHGTRYTGGQPLAHYQGNRLTWDLQNIAAGEERRVRVDVESTHGGVWKAEATLTVSVHQSLQTNVSAAAPQLLTVTGPAVVTVGYPVRFAIRVTNTTPAPLTDVVVGVRMSPGLEHLQGEAIEGSLGELAPGKTRELTLEAVTTQQGRLTLDATVLSCNKAVATGQAAVTATEAPALALKLTALPPSAAKEQDFQLDIINRGTSDLGDIEVTETLPDGLDFVTAGAGVYDHATIRWNIGTLAAGQIRQVTFRTAIRSSEPQRHRITARAANGTDAVLHSILRQGQ